MPSSAATSIRAQIEASLAGRIPAALTPQPRILRRGEATNIAEIDALFPGGLPAGAIGEIVGPESSGRTSLALAFVAGRTQAGKVCAWIDASNTFDPESAAAIGVDLSRLLWVRCGVASKPIPVPARKPWRRLDQALRATDLLLEAGGFAAMVLDMGGILPEHASRVPLATWFRFRAAAERAQLNFLLLTRHPCAKNSAGMVLRLEPGEALRDELTLFTGMEHRARLEHRRFTQSQTEHQTEHQIERHENLLPPRKPPQSAHVAVWRSRTQWAGRE